MNTRSPVADRIVEAMEARKLGQTELGALLGVPQPTVQKWVRRGSPPGAEILVRIPAALGINGHWLLTGDGSMEPPDVPADFEQVRQSARREALREAQRAIEGLASEASLSGAAIEKLAGQAETGFRTLDAGAKSKRKKKAG